MATLSGALRSYGASVRRAERERQRRNREAARQYKEYQKQLAIANAIEEYNSYKEYIEVLTSIHKDCSEKYEWESMLEENPPFEPQKGNFFESKAQEQIENFKPTMFGKLFGMNKKKLERLRNNLEYAKLEDETAYNENIEEYKKNYKQWEYMQSIAKGILSKDIEYYQHVLENYDPFEDLKYYGSSFDISVSQDYLVINFNVNSPDIIPTVVKTLTSTNKLSVKKMPQSKFNELYQDYVCGCVLRSGREIYSLLPVKLVIIHAIGELLNSKTGYIENQPILSIAIPPTTLEKLNFDFLDCSDSMSNFVHNMNFSKTKGFAIVDKLSIEDFEIS